jgi:hypothetical protein
LASTFSPLFGKCWKLPFDPLVDLQQADALTYKYIKKIDRVITCDVLDNTFMMCSVVAFSSKVPADRGIMSLHNSLFLVSSSKVPVDRRWISWLSITLCFGNTCNLDPQLKDQGSCYLTKLALTGTKPWTRTGPAKLALLS